MIMEHFCDDILVIYKVCLQNIILSYNIVTKEGKNSCCYKQMKKLMLKCSSASLKPCTLLCLMSVFIVFVILIISIALLL
jgi:hypothetical protein